MKREIHQINGVISPMQIESLGDTGLVKYEKHIEEKLLRDLGLAYARKYAKLKISYVYFNAIENQLDSYDEQQDTEENQHLRLIHKQFRYSLD